MSQIKTYLMCSLRYSDNLGDGVIGDSLSYIFKSIDSELTIVHYDMAGRPAFAARNSEAVSLKKRLFYRLPSCLKFAATVLWWMLSTKKLVGRSWKACEPRSPYCLVFAGGQVISDIALNFPLKFNRTVALASRSSCPIAIYSMGVSDRFSPLGRMLFRRAFRGGKFRYVAARDCRSQANIGKKLGIHREVSLSVDPAVFCAEAYSISKKKNARLRVGIGIAHPAELSTHLHNDEKIDEFSFSDPMIRLVAILRENDIDVCLFNNGSAEDDYFMRQVVKRADKLYGKPIATLPRPLTPKDLVKNISSFDVVVAHRLHANIIAFSLCIPSIGLCWDEKVASFFEKCKRTEWKLDSSASAEEIFTKIQSAITDHTLRDKVSAMKDHAVSNAKQLIDAVNA